MPHRDATGLTHPPSVAAAGTAPADRPLRGPILAAALIVLVVGVAAPFAIPPDSRLTRYFLDGDCLALIAMAPVLTLAGLVSPRAARKRRAGPALSRISWVHPRDPAASHAKDEQAFADRSTKACLGLAIATTALALALTAILHGGYSLSYDEVMAVFDSAIIRDGHLIAPVPPEWRADVPALAPHFLLPVPGNAAWVSSYLPVNAMLRAGFGLLGASALAGPVLAGVAVLAAMGIARRLWPDRPDAAVVAGLLIATSPQVIVTATTAYAMSAHLAFNLVWLWLFLRGGRIGHGAAAAVGVLACGLHQIVFHPLFALPFVACLAARRRWGLSVFYAAVYGTAGLAWTLYWPWLLAGRGNGDAAALSSGGGHFVATAIELLKAFQWGGIGLMAMNLVRFVAWQNPLLLPLAALAWPALRRGDGLARPLAAGIGLTLVTMFLLLPYQGHGWGYRYLHGLIGSAGLVAAQGWVTATRDLAAQARAAARGAVGLASAATLLVLLPLQASGAYRFAAPYAASTDAIAAMDADAVLVDDRWIPFGTDLARNAPDLSNRPEVLLLRRLDPAQLRALCQRGTVAVFGRREAERAGFSLPNQPDDPAWAAARAVLAEPGCRRRSGTRPDGATD